MLPRSVGPRRRRSTFGSVLLLISCCSLAIATAEKELPGNHAPVQNVAVGIDDDASSPTLPPTKPPPPPPPQPQPPLVPGAIVRVDLSRTSPTPPLLWGLFIEEIQHAGDGGIYAELVQDRSFGGTARALGGVGEATGRLEARVPPGGVPWARAMTEMAKTATPPRADLFGFDGEEEAGGGESGGGRRRERTKRAQHRYYRHRSKTAGSSSSSVGDDGPVPGSGLPPAWAPLSDSSVVTLVAGSGGGGDEDGTDLVPPPPLPPPPPPPPPEANGRRLSLRVARAPPPGNASSSPAAVVGVSNPGFWGIPVRPGDEFDLVAWLFVPAREEVKGVKRSGKGGDGPAAASSSVVVELVVSSSGAADSVVAASAVLVAPSLGNWNRVEARLVVPPVGDGGGEEKETALPAASARLVVRTPDESPNPPAPPRSSREQQQQQQQSQLAFALAAVSLFPAANGPLGSVSPFRADILASLKKLKPRFLRVPGGCYVEGDTLADAFDWASTVRPPLARPGHWNGPWRYFSTDGLGIFEWLQLAEELGAPAVWVQSAGVAHRESLPTSGGGGAALAESALAALEFALGDASSSSSSSSSSSGGERGEDRDIKNGAAISSSSSTSSSSPWADLRASVFNRSAPFPPFAALAVGNEDCGKPFYATNFATIREAVRLRFPGLAVVGNCGGGFGGEGDHSEKLDQDLFDWHYYGSADDLWNHRDVFSKPPAPGDPAPAPYSASGATAFATEFAAFDWGIPTAPAGWLHGAVAEAGFMAGLENAAMGSSSSSSSRAAVAGGAFAPALAHARGTGNCPTSLVVFDSEGRAFETPSFFVQELFANAAGRALAACSTTSGSGGGGALGGVAASASCARERCLGGEDDDDESSTSSSGAVFVKVVNYGPLTRRVRVALVESSSGVNGTTERPVPLARGEAAASATLLAHPDPAASNSFENPTNVRPVKVPLRIDEQPGSSAAADGGIVELEMPPYSLAVLEVEGMRRRRGREEEWARAAVEEQR